MQTHYYPWQEKAWQQVQSQWQQHKLPHALLFAGTRDLGKRTFVQAFARYLLCTQAGDAACGRCQSCLWMAAGTHPDFFSITPDAEAKTAVIKIEQIRDLLECLTQTAQNGSQHQVVVIEPAESMNKSAANALLKTLEEPPGRVIFLIISHQPTALLPTLRSRCQWVNFAIPPVASSLSWLQSRCPDQKDIALTLSLAENIPLRALTWVEQGHFTLEAHTKIVENFMDLSCGQLDPLLMAVACMEADFEPVFNTLWLILGDLIRLKLDPNVAICHVRQAERLKAISQKIALSTLFQRVDALLAAKKRVDAKINLNMQLLYESWFAEFAIPLAG